MSTRTLLLITVDTESSMAGTTPLPPEVMVYGRLGGGAWGIERIMACCEARGLKATFFVSTLEELHHGRDHVAAMCAAVLDRGHDAQLHLHPNWWRGDFARKCLCDYSLDEQLEILGAARDAFRRACGHDPLAHRAGGLWLGAETLRALETCDISIDSSVALGYHPYRLGEGLAAANVPRRLGPLVEVPVTTFAQVRLGRWAPRRNFDVNADSLAELRLVVDRAAHRGVAAVCLLMHSFSFIRWNAERTDFWPARREAEKFERFLAHVAAREDVEAVTFGELAARLERRPELLEGPDFAPTAGLARTYLRSWERFHVGWKNKAVALGLPAAAGGIAALAGGALWRLLR
ncbi:MAG: hypothetical protein ACLF0G_14500 [Candidatus Brocadiia bacterium]